MPKHTPTVEKILAADIEVRLYALNGYAHALAATIEQGLFWCFVAATNKPVEEAAAEFYRHVRFSWKLPLADAAVYAKTEGTADAKKWADLNRRAQELLGQDDNNRNLVSHNPMFATIYIEEGVTLLTAEPHQIIVAPEVRQSPVLVKSGRRKEQKVGVREMANYCDKLIELALDLDRFLEEALGYPQKHPDRCAWR